MLSEREPSTSAGSSLTPHSLPRPVTGPIDGTAGAIDAVEFRRVVGRSAHMLNNILTALYCQWDLCCSQSGEEGAPGVEERQFKAYLDKIALEARTLSCACADFPITEPQAGSGQAADSPHPACATPK